MSIPVGALVEVRGKGLRGICRFCGEAQFSAGVWVGIELSDATGKNDGSVQGVRYFECEPNHGIFVKESLVDVVGDPSKPVAPASASSAPSTPVKTHAPPSAAATPVPAPAPAAAPTPADAAAPQLPTITAAKPATPAAPTTSTATAATPAAAAAPPASPAPGGASGLELLKTVRELNDYKLQAQDEIRQLTKKLAAFEQQLEKQAGEFNKEREQAKVALRRAQETGAKQLEAQKAKFDEEKQDLQNQIASLTDDVEMLAVDKELAETKLEELKDELSLLQQEVELERETKKLVEKQNEEQQAAESVAASSGSASSDGADSAAVKRLTERNSVLVGETTQLKATLLTLRDLSLAQKAESDRRVKDLEKTVKELTPLKETVEKLEKELAARSKQIEGLNRQIDSLDEAQQMIEKLTDRNMELEETVEERNEEIAELQEMKDVSEQLEEARAHVEKQLRSQLYAKEIELLDVGTTVTNLKNEIFLKSKAIADFKLMVKQQADEIAALKQQTAEASSQSVSVEQEFETVKNNLQMMRSSAVKATAVKVDQQIAVVLSTQAAQQLAFIADYVPRETFQADLQTLNLVLALRRIHVKSAIVLENVEHFTLPPPGLQRSGVDLAGEDEVEAMWKLGWACQDILNVAGDFEFSLQRCSTEVYLKVGNLAGDVAPLERQVDGVVQLLKDEQLSSRRQQVVETMRAVERRLLSLWDTYCRPVAALPAETLWLRLVQQFRNTANTYLAQASRLDTTVATFADISGSVVEQKVGLAKLRHIVELGKRIQTQAATHRHAELADQTLESLKVLKLQFDKGTAAFADAMARLSKQASEAFASTTDQPAAWARFHKDIDSASFDWLAEVAAQVFQKFSLILEQLQTAEALPAGPADGGEGAVIRGNAYQERAKLVKTQLGDAASLRLQIEALRSDLNKAMADLKQKARDVADLQWKEEQLTGKLRKSQAKEQTAADALLAERATAEKQDKMYKDALDALQHDLEELRALNKKLQQQVAEASSASASVTSRGLATPTKAGSGVRTVVADAGGGAAAAVVGAGSSEADLQRIAALQQAVEYLTASVAELRASRAKELTFSMLPPLPVVVTAAAAANVAFAANGTPGVALSLCKQELAELQHAVRASQSKPTLVDLSNVRRSRVSIAQAKARDKDLQLRCDALRDRLRGAFSLATSSSSSSSPTTVAAADLAALQNPVGKVVLAGSGASRRVVVGPEAMQKIHASFVF